MVAAGGFAVLLGAVVAATPAASAASYWVLGAWSECDNACGEGRRTRQVACVDPSGAAAEPRACPRPVPPSESSCHRALSAEPKNRGLDFCELCPPRSSTCDRCLKGFTLREGKCINDGHLATQTYHISAQGVILDDTVQHFGADVALKSALLANGLNTSVTSQRGQACVTVRVVSAAYSDGNAAEFYLGDDSKAAWSGTTSGLNVMVVQLDSTGVKVKHTKGYDFYNRAKQASADLAYDVDQLDAGDVVLVALKDSGMENVDQAAIGALRLLGAVASGPGSYRTAYALIGSKGRSKAHAEVSGGGKEEVGSSICSAVAMFAVLEPQGGTDDDLKEAVRRFRDVDPALLASRITKALGALAPPGVAVAAPDTEGGGLCPGLLDWVNRGCAEVPSGGGGGDNGLK